MVNLSKHACSDCRNPSAQNSPGIESVSSDRLGIDHDRIIIIIIIWRFNPLHQGQPLPSKSPSAEADDVDGSMHATIQALPGRYMDGIAYP